MATRTVRVYGKAYGSDVTLNMDFGGSNVYSGTVPSVTGTPDMRLPFEDMDILCTVSIDTSVSGDQAVSIRPTNGDLVWMTMWGNYNGGLYEEVTPATVPATYNLITSTVDHYDDLSQGVTSGDGHTNVQLDGVAQTTDPIDDNEAAGIWHWLVEDGEALTCDVWVSDSITEDTPPQ